MQYEKIGRQRLDQVKNIKKVLAIYMKIGYNNFVFWLIGQAVKTSPSHGENSGSIPL